MKNKWFSIRRPPIRDGSRCVCKWIITEQFSVWNVNHSNRINSCQRHSYDLCSHWSLRSADGDWLKIWFSHFTKDWPKTDCTIISYRSIFSACDPCFAFTQMERCVFWHLIVMHCKEITTDKRWVCFCRQFNSTGPFDHCSLSVWQRARDREETQ